MKSKTSFLISLLLLLTIACTCVPLSLVQQGAAPEILLPPTQQESVSAAPYLSEITFCHDVTDDGIPIDPTDEFPPGTVEVWAFFTYDNMQDGMAWGRLWRSEGEIWLDIRQDTWEDGESGWAAYGVTEDDPSSPLSGTYSLTIYLNDQIVREDTFYVNLTPAQTSPTLSAFGAIQFAAGITNEVVPYGVAEAFEYGVTEVYAVFPFFNMQDGQSFRREWLKDGEIYAERDMAWEEGSIGMDYARLLDEDGLPPGEYTLNLYIDGQVARSAGFTICTAQPEAREPALPQEIIDDYLMPAWENLANSEHKVLRDLAQFALNNHVSISVDPNFDGQAAYRYTCSTPPVMGEVVFSLSYWKRIGWEETTAVLAHELVHAFQHKTGDYRCGCSIEKEYYAWIAQFYVLQEMGRKDILADKYADAYDSRTGKFDSDRLWALLIRLYPECPEY